ncbi:right-handed parallel beta-helix repeat-containing protein [Bacillus solimangrovi]|uniref:Right handed beta helix domain-containing protein n=1 Tax=Bacillus solimangrovi TaxID=1305675 RepID=A0A1E5LD68_9BACI|nr:right-handed parallel beta-helix repeat-containing protein [Bacillus solimangrovi]OEH92037.1 hypothetical protein BFG57_17105 [Bacillus solimangrovi]
MAIHVVPTEFATVQEAIDDVGTMAGDSIQILAGTFDGFNVDKERLKIFGCGVGKTIIAGNPGLGNDGVVVNANQTTLQGFTVQGFTGFGVMLNANFNVLKELESNFNGSNGLEIEGESNFITHCTGSNNEADGISTGNLGDHNCMTSCNSIQNKDDGFDIRGLNNKFLFNLAKENVSDGFELSTDGDSMAILFGNKFLKNVLDGINDVSSPNCNIISNLVCNNGQSGIFVGAFFSVFDSNIVRNNGTSGAGSGILVADIFAVDNTIRFNKLKLNMPDDIEAEGNAINVNTFDGNKCESSSPPGLCT